MASLWSSAAADNADASSATGAVPTADAEHRVVGLVEGKCGGSGQTVPPFQLLLQMASASTGWPLVPGGAFVVVLLLLVAAGAVAGAAVMRVAVVAGHREAWIRIE